MIFENTPNQKKITFRTKPRIPYMRGYHRRNLEFIDVQQTLEAWKIAVCEGEEPLINLKCVRYLKKNSRTNTGENVGNHTSFFFNHVFIYLQCPGTLYLPDENYSVSFLVAGHGYGWIGPIPKARVWEINCLNTFGLSRNSCTFQVLIFCSMI